MTMILGLLRDDLLMRFLFEKAMALLVGGVLAKAVDAEVYWFAWALGLYYVVWVWGCWSLLNRLVRRRTPEDQ